MAENRVSIIINAKNEAGAALNQAKRDVDSLGSSAGSAGSAMGKASRDVDGFGRAAGSASQASRNLEGSLSSTMSTALRFAGVIASGLLFNSAIQSAYSYNRTLEDSQLGLASLAYTTMQFADAQGKALTGQTAFNESLKFSSQFQEKLRIAGLQTAATFEQLSSTVTQAWTPAVRAGFNPDQIISFTSATTQAATAMGINLNQMGEEIRSVLTGTMTSMNTRLMPLMQSVGLTNEKLQELARTGQLYPAVMKAFEGATLAAEKANVSLGVSFSNLQDATQSILGIGLKPFFDQLGASARDLTGHIFTVKDGTIIWNQSLMELAGSIGRAMGEAVRWTYEHVSAVIKWNDEHRELLKITGMVVAVLGSVLLAFKALMFIDSVTASLAAFRTSVLSVNVALLSLNTILGSIGAFLIGWNIGKSIGEMELFGHSVNTWTQLLLAQLDMSINKDKEALQAKKDMLIADEQRQKQAHKTADEVVKATQKEVDAKIQERLLEQQRQEEAKKNADTLKKLDEDIWKAKTDLIEDETAKQQEILKHDYEERKTKAQGNSAVLNKIEEWRSAEMIKIRHDAEAKSADDAKKEAERRQQEYSKVSEDMWKEETELIKDETAKQLATEQHHYEQRLEEVKGNQRLIEQATRIHTLRVDDIKRKASEKEKADQEQLQRDITAKIAEYDNIIEQNHEKSLGQKHALNQTWYEKEYAALGTYIEKKGIAEADAEVAYSKLLEARDEKNKKADREELDAIKEKVKAWDKAYEQIQETLTGFIENGKLDLDSFAKAFKNMVANLVSSWMVNMARLSLPAWMGGWASAPVPAGAGGTTPGGSNGSGSGGANTPSQVNSAFGEFLTGGWATKLGSYLSENGASSVGEWFKNAGTDGIFSGAGGAGVTTAVATALIQGTMTGDWKKSFVSGIGTGLGAAIGTSILGPGLGTLVGATLGGAVANTASNTAIQYATYGSVLPGLGTSIGYVAGTIVGDKKDDANLFMSFGDPDKTVNQYDQFYGDPNKALYSPTGGGDWAYDPKKEWSVSESDVFAVDLRKGTYGISGDQIIKIENTVSDYFKNIFKTIDKTLGTSVKDFIRSSGIGLSINIENFQKYMKEENIDAVIKNMTGQFFDAYGSALATSILNADASGLFTSEALTSLQNSGETLGDTFARVAGLLQKVPEGVRRIREIMAEGLTEAEAFQKLEGQYEFVSGILGNALSEAMKKGVEVADFETFKNTFTTSLENQLKAAVAAAFQQQILTRIISASFGSMANFGDVLEQLQKGEITVEAFKSYLRTGVAAARAALQESEPLMNEFWDIIGLTPSKADTALEQAKTYATNVVSGTITSALQMGVDAADWNVFKNNIQSQLNNQLQTIVLNSIASSMINSVISSVLPDGGGIEKLNKDFLGGIITAEEYGSRIQALGTSITAAIAPWEPVFGSILTALNIKPKETKADPVSEMAAKPDAVNTAIKQFKDNSADADLMLSFMDALVSKIPLMADDYAVLDAAIIKHREGLAEYGSGLSELTTSITGYVAEIKEQVNGLASAAGEAAQKAADAAKAASEAAKSAADSAKSAGEQKGLLLAINRNTSNTAAALDRLSPDGDALQVRTAS